MQNHLRITLLLLPLAGASCVQVGNEAAPPSSAEATEAPSNAQPVAAASPSELARKADAGKRDGQREVAFSDFNGNGIVDTFDIVLGTSLDENFNGIPDEAEVTDPDM